MRRSEYVYYPGSGGQQQQQTQPPQNQNHTQASRQDYSEVYGLGLLDDIHNIFPELMYDAEIFDYPFLTWMRSRITQLYPQTYRNMRLEYQANQQQVRRADFDNWTFLQRQPTRSIFSNSPIQTPVRRQPVNTYTVPLNSTFHGPLLRAQTNPFLFTGTPTVQPTNTLFFPDNQAHIELSILDLLGDIGRGRTNTWLNAFMNAVPVSATASDIEAGTELLLSENVSADTICAICQDHDSPSPRESSTDSASASASWGGGSPRRSQATEGDEQMNATPATATPRQQGVNWRRLKNCAHMFHRPCIDRWFEGHVHCPVCRADIRDAARLQRQQGQPSRESEEESS